jgi:uncharacterized protein (DUF433 family)
MMTFSGFDRITSEPDKLGGRPAVRGLRISVALIVNLVANGSSVEEILEDYPLLEAEDIRQALLFAGALATEEVHPFSLAS